MGGNDLGKEPKIVHGVGVVMDIVTKFPLYKECPICSRSIELGEKACLGLLEHVTLRCEHCKQTFPWDVSRWRFRLSIRVCPIPVHFRCYLLQTVTVVEETDNFTPWKYFHITIHFSLLHLFITVRFNYSIPYRLTSPHCDLA